MSKTPPPSTAKQATPNKGKKAPRTYGDALKALADETKRNRELERQLAIAKRDYEVARRERDHYKKKCADKAPRITQGQRIEWSSTSTIPWLHSVFAPSEGLRVAVGRALTKLGREMGVAPLKMKPTDPRSQFYHHVTVIDALRRELDSNPKLLGRYRV